MQLYRCTASEPAARAGCSSQRPEGMEVGSEEESSSEASRWWREPSRQQAVDLGQTGAIPKKKKPDRSIPQFDKLRKGPPPQAAGGPAPQPKTTPQATTNEERAPAPPAKRPPTKSKGKPRIKSTVTVKPVPKQAPPAPKPPAKRSEPIREITRGIMFGGLNPVPVDKSLDPPPHCCYRCWRGGHSWPRCPQPGNWSFCSNCGRRNVEVSTCPRCRDIHRQQMEEKHRDERQWRREHQHERNLRRARARSQSQARQSLPREEYREEAPQSYLWQQEEVHSSRQTRSPSLRRANDEERYHRHREEFQYLSSTDRHEYDTRRSPEGRYRPEDYLGQRWPSPRRGSRDASRRSATPSRHREQQYREERRHSPPRRPVTPESTSRRDRSERDREETLLTFFRYIQGLPEELRVIAVRDFYGTDPAPGGREWARWT